MYYTYKKKILLKSIQKQHRRLLRIATSSLYNILLPFINVIISLLVVRLTSVSLWGHFVAIMLWVQLGAMVVGWGNKEYLLRAFSQRPSALAALWQSSLLTRSVLLPPVALGIVLILLVGERADGLLTGLACLWLAALFLQQSFDVLVVYRRAFGWATAVEATVTAGMVAFLFGRGNRLTVHELAGLFTAAVLCKGLAMGLRFRRDITGNEASASRFQSSFWREAFIFFLLGFSGMLNSRIDLYSVNALLTSHDVGIYQVYSNLLLYLQSIVLFILTPFLSILFRLNSVIIRKISRQLFIVAIIGITPMMIIIDIFLNFLYHIALEPIFFVLGGLYVLPIYYYLPVIYTLYKNNRQIVVLYVNIAGTLINLLLNIVLLPKIGLIGAIMNKALIGWIIWLFYYRQQRLAG
jgi:O-antigen/teichoic acid export membrane protein